LIKRIDKSKAERLPGVKAVLTHEDIPDWKGGTPRHLPILDRKAGMSATPWPLLQRQAKRLPKKRVQKMISYSGDAGLFQNSPIFLFGHSIRS
jgi:xanthine dehydrogenase molybdenum-binding subunit